MVQILPQESGWGDVFKEFGQGLAHGHATRHDEMALQSAIHGLGPNASPKDILNAVTGAKTYHQEAKQNFFKNYLGAEEFEEIKRKTRESENLEKAKVAISKAKEERETTEKVTKEKESRTNTQNIVSQLDLPEAQKKVLGDTLTQKAAEDLLKQQMKPTKETEEKLSPFEKKLQEKYADEYINTTNEIPKIQDSLNTIEEVRKLAQSRYLQGPLVGNIPTESAKELEAKSFILLQAPIKVFNPTGPLATKKLEQLKDIYLIKPTDTKGQVEGKLKALELFNKQALARAQGKLALLKNYKGNPPAEIADQYDKETETLNDAMLDYDLVGEEAKDVPADAKKFKGETVTGPDGKKYYSDGTKWVKR